MHVHDTGPTLVQAGDRRDESVASYGRTGDKEGGHLCDARQARDHLLNVHDVHVRSTKHVGDGLELSRVRCGFLCFCD